MDPPSAQPERYTAKIVGALPLLRAFLQRIDFATIIDRVIPSDPQAYLSLGQVAECLAANRLSSPRPLYRVEEWAQRAGVEQVFGFAPAWLNDDRLARALDRLAENAKTLKGEIALAVANTFGIELRRLHYDLTTVWVEGEYHEEQADAIRIEYTKDNVWQTASKAFRVALSTFDDGRGGVTLGYQPLDGTEQTSAAAVNNMKALRELLGARVDRVLQVSDRAGVTADVVATASSQGFHILGPLILNASLERLVRDHLARNPGWQAMSYVSERQGNQPPSKQDRYRAFELPYTFVHEIQDGQKKERKEYPARLLVIESDGKRKRDENSRKKHQERIEKQLTELQEKAKSAKRRPKLIPKVKAILDRYHEGAFYEVTFEGPPEAPTAFSWRIMEERVAHAKVLEGIYAAATTLPPDQPLDTVFTHLKQQWRVEDSHRILKGPLRISPVFLHHPKRIEGLIFVLWLALIAYQLLEREWRQKNHDPKRARWTTRLLLRFFEAYCYVGVTKDDAIRWVPAVVSPVEVEIFTALQLRRPDSS